MYSELYIAAEKKGGQKSLSSELEDRSIHAKGETRTLWCCKMELLERSDKHSA
jgi:hypothetical protein